MISFFSSLNFGIIPILFKPSFVLFSRLVLISFIDGSPVQEKTFHSSIPITVFMDKIFRRNAQERKYYINDLFFP